MNIIKTKSMVIRRKKPGPNISISVEGKPIQQVDRLVYLGYMATEDEKCDKEIKRRIGIDWKNCIWEYGKDCNIKKHPHWIKIAHSKILYLVNTFIWSRNMDTN